MKLIIHCGFHKTGSTSFQEICANNRDLLKTLGVYYPEYKKWNQHGYILWEVQKNGLEILGDYFREVFSGAGPDCNTVLLSGEDLENCIVDVELAAEIERLALSAGFNEVDWAIVTRTAQEYISSLYSEKSKHGVVLQPEILQKAAMERGCFYLSTLNFNYIFIFDYQRFSGKFRRHVSGNVIDFNFKDFLNGFPGRILLEHLLGKHAFTDFEMKAGHKLNFTNRRLDIAQVEANYISNAFGIKRIRKKKYRIFLMPFIWLRLRKAKKLVG